ncbi:MAG: DNA-binding protein [Candidatus Omnitrophota bacterium]|jgi:hypothetical protein|nr:MAG: DNA-binding protein [Candidatus Omnitrophota bacterium]
MIGKPSVYIETTIPSFLTGHPTNNLIVAGKQEVTRQWWETRRHRFELFISPYVHDEASAGDSDAVRRRMEAIESNDLLEVDDEVLHLTDRIMETGMIPEKSKTDAAHIAVASRHTTDYLLTWNCRYIANAEILSTINFAVFKAGYLLPTICTPDELFGGEEDEG